MLSPEIVGPLVFVLLVIIGCWIDTVNNRALSSIRRRSKAPSIQIAKRDLRSVYWQKDPIAVRVVRDTPYAGTTGDIEPDEGKIGPRTKMQLVEGWDSNLYAHPAIYELGYIRIPPGPDVIVRLSDGSTQTFRPGDLVDPQWLEIVQFDCGAGKPSAFRAVSRDEFAEMLMKEMEF